VIIDYVPVHYRYTEIELEHSSVAGFGMEITRLYETYIYAVVVKVFVIITGKICPSCCCCCCFLLLSANMLCLCTAIFISIISFLLCRVRMSNKKTFCLIAVALVFGLIFTFCYSGYEKNVSHSDKAFSVEQNAVKEDRSQLSSGSEQRNYDFLEFADSFNKALSKTSEDRRDVISPSSSSYSVHIPVVNVPGINCAALFNGSIQDIAQAHAQQKKWPKQTIPDNIYVTAAAECMQYISQRRFTMHPLSVEEAAFSIAFSIVMFRDVEHFERLLRAIYRPQNFYCVHVDKKSASAIHKSVAAIASCFSNVFIAPHIIDVQWCTYTVLEPELICMEALLSRSRKWQYFINLTGQEFPLKTNWDIVKILKVLRGANNMEGTVKRLLSDMLRFVCFLCFCLTSAGFSCIVMSYCTQVSQNSTVFKLPFLFLFLSLLAVSFLCLQCFDAIGYFDAVVLAAGRAFGL